MHFICKCVSFIALNLLVSVFEAEQIFITMIHSHADVAVINTRLFITLIVSVWRQETPNQLLSLHLFCVILIH